jgi:hypothetical protein
MNGYTGDILYSSRKISLHIQKISMRSPEKISIHLVMYGDVWICMDILGYP